MFHISYHASQEQFAPSDLLKYAVLAEKTGFTACHSSDHFHPWSERQGQSGLTFAWLGAAMQATKFPFSSIIAPGQRYHPAIVAQGIATLAEMFPDRFEIALGSGEALNEVITGEPWPEKPERNARLLECNNVIKRLLDGETVNHTGLVNVKEAKLYTRPTKLPRIFCAAITEETARWAGTWADGMVTINKPIEDLKKMIKAFYDGGGQGKAVHVQIAFGYARDESKALESAYEQWSSNLSERADLANFYKVEQFDKHAESVSKQDVKSKLLVSSDPKKHLQQILKVKELGVENIVLHNVTIYQEEFIEDFGKEVIPELIK
ncbi:MAG: TIGR03885 family FMN-dependent LLM class oxidoreductase [Opitutaceae bacterium]|nr:TIGR03885 family FMN-dependent LLM class oxidoreductase [Cytophagales bacterium]